VKENWSENTTCSHLAAVSYNMFIKVILWLSGT